MNPQPPNYHTPPQNHHHTYEQTSNYLPYNPHYGLPAHATTIVPNPFPWWAHLIHAVGTLFTCGLWGFVWVIHYALRPKTKLTQTVTHWQHPTPQGN